MNHTLIVNATWDQDAGMWVATSEEIPGLVTEAVTLDGLLQRVTAVAPELIADNRHQMRQPLQDGQVLDIHIISQLTVHSGRAA